MSFSSKRSKIIEILACPQCKSSLPFDDLHCQPCGARFRRKGDQILFDLTWTSESLAERNWLNRLKEKVKRLWPGLYPALLSILAPVYTGRWKKTVCEKVQPEKVTVNVGAGTSTLLPCVINIDLAPYATVDLAASVYELPIRSESVDMLVNVAVLEHLSDPASAVREFHRILKPGGQIFAFIPFLQGIHASPNDFQRYTPEGLKVLFRDFEIRQIYGRGPTSALIWTLQEWIALVLSFGSTRLYRILLPLTWVLSPLKYLDALISHHPQAEVIATGFYIEAVKPKA